jgi:glucose/arabinose dehydrogenase
VLARHPRLLAPLLIAAILAVAGLVAPASASALTLEQVGSFDRPTYVTSDPRDPNRLFVVEQAGRIMLVDNNVTEFLDIEPLVHDLNPFGDYGMFSIAFSPNFANDQLFYVTYSGADDPSTMANESDWHLDEFRAEGDVANPASRREVLTIQPPQSHFGGQLHFGPDGYLYASTGDGGPQGDTNGRAQDLGSLLGKILRIDPEGSAPGEYTVPADNPFTGTAGDDEIWSFGLRHPWRFSFDRLTGNLAVSDVGWQAWEEVNFDTGPNPGRGDNYGWRCREGAHPGPGAATQVCVNGAGTFTEPVFEYAHVDPDGACSITGGYVVRDHGLGGLYGRYLYADFCVGELRSLQLGLPMAAGDRSEGVAVPQPTSFGEDANCRLYVTSFNGPVYRLREPASGTTSGCQPSAGGVLGASNDFRLGKLKRNLKKGIAFITVFLPGPGQIGLEGKGLASVPLSRAGASREVTAAGPVRLRIAPAKKGKRARKIRRALRRKGKATVKPRITFVPTGGVAGAQVMTIRLLQRTDPD